MNFKRRKNSTLYEPLVSLNEQRKNNKKKTLAVAWCAAYADIILNFLMPPPKLPFLWESFIQSLLPKIAELCITLVLSVRVLKCDPVSRFIRNTKTNLNIFHFSIHELNSMLPLWVNSTLKRTANIQTKKG